MITENEDPTRPCTLILLLWAGFRGDDWVMAPCSFRSGRDCLKSFKMDDLVNPLNLLQI